MKTKYRLTKFPLINFLTTKKALILFFYFLLFAITLIGPSYYFLSDSKDSLLDYFTKHNITDVALYEESRNKITEIFPWIIVGVTSLFVVVGNTLIYFWTFFRESMEKTIAERAKNIRYFIVLLFIIWFSILGYFSYNSVFKALNDFNIKLDSIINLPTSKNIVTSPDLEIVRTIEASLYHFIHNLEIYTIILIVIFVFIDLLSYRANKLQLTEEEENLKNESDEIQKSHITNEIREIKLELDFILNQLTLIDLPIIAGLSLIIYYTFNLASVRNVEPDAVSAFTIGSIAMHLILSQIIFLVLVIKNSYKDFLIKYNSI